MESSNRQKLSLFSPGHSDYSPRVTTSAPNLQEAKEEGNCENRSRSTMNVIAFPARDPRPKSIAESPRTIEFDDFPWAAGAEGAMVQGSAQPRLVRKPPTSALPQLRPTKTFAQRSGEWGMATAEYAIATLAAVGFAGLLVAILRSDEVRGFLMNLIRTALGTGQ